MKETPLVAFGHQGRFTLFSKLSQCDKPTSTSEVATDLPCLTAAEVPPLEVVEYGHFDFASPSSEQEIWAFRGLKRDFSTGLLFWVKTLQAQGWDDRPAYFVPYAEAGICEPMTVDEFASLVAKCRRSLRQSLPPLSTSWWVSVGFVDIQ